MGIEMDKTFNAANGLQVRRAENGGVEIGKPGYLDYTGPAATMALEEFLRAERDEALGWWRSPMEPEWVAKEDDPDGYGRRVVVLFNERTFRTHYVNSVVAEVPPSGDDHGKHRAARAYFEAHPERNAWEDSLPGEVWVLTHRGIESAWIAGHGDFAHLFEREGVSISKVHSDTTAGRRIWPEDAS